MDPEHPALKTATLPQYQDSAAFMERFLDAIHYEDQAITRATNVPGFKSVDGSELRADYLDYFEDNKQELEEEFFEDLVQAIGCSKAIWFCFVVAHDWYDGKGLRNGKRVEELKRAVSARIAWDLGGRPLSSVATNHALPAGSSMLTPEDVGKILDVNKMNLMEHMEEWKHVH